MVILVNLNTFALNADIILFDDKDLNNSHHIKIPYHAFASVADLAVSKKVSKIIIQGTPNYCSEYKDNLEEVLALNYSKEKINIVIDGGSN